MAVRLVSNMENELVELRVYHGRRNRISRKPWLYKHCGQWYCVSNSGTLLRPRLVQGISSTPWDAWLAWAFHLGGTK